MATRSPAGNRATAGLRTAGRELVSWRGRAPSGALPGTGSSHRSCGRVSLSPTAAIHPPSGSQPIVRQTPGQGWMPSPFAVATARRAGDAWPRARSRRDPVERAHDEVDEPVVDAGMGDELGVR